MKKHTAVAFTRVRNSFPGPDNNPILNALWPNHVKPKPVPALPLEITVGELKPGMKMIKGGLEVRVGLVTRDCLTRRIRVKYTGIAKEEIFDYRDKIIISQ